MIDLDSNPTKLIELVEIGKQLLMTRGSLTTFSIANDVAKYFAIIPAMFAATYPALNALNIMRLHSPQSAILARVIFNALIIIALIPLALRGVRYRPVGRGRHPAPQFRHLRHRRRDRPLHRDQAHRCPPRLPAPGVTMIREHLRPAIVLTLLLCAITGLLYPGVVTVLAQLLFPSQANGSLIVRDGQLGRQRADRAGIHRAVLLPSAARRPPARGTTPPRRGARTRARRTASSPTRSSRRQWRRWCGKTAPGRDTSRRTW